MVRPLRGQQEVFRRLNERNEARRVRTNEVRELGGLEPIPDPQEIPNNVIFTGNEYQDYLAEYLNRYVGTPNTNYHQRTLLEGLQQGTVNLIAGRSRPGRSTMDYVRGTSSENIRGQRANYIYFDTEADLSRRITETYGTPWHPDSNPVNEVHQSYDIDWSDKMVEKNPQWAWLTGKLTYEQYQRQDKINDLKKQKKIKNRDASFILEKEY